jgi:hypothetical protein
VTVHAVEDDLHARSHEADSSLGSLKRAATA